MKWLSLVTDFVLFLDECDELINRKLVVIQIVSECLLGNSN
jgi:hypothetical protein